MPRIARIGCMKRIIAILIMLMLITLPGCKAEKINESSEIGEPTVTVGGQSMDDSGLGNGQNADELLVAKKIVFITNINSDPEAALNFEALVDKFGEERVIRKAWPNDGSEKYINEIVQEVSDDSSVGAVILTSSAGNSFIINSINSLASVREDIFIVYVPSIFWGLPSDVDPSLRADLIIMTDIQRFGESYVRQALSMGADTIVHYSFPRDNAQPAYAIRRDAMKAEAERMGVGFIEVETLDPFSDPTAEIVPAFIAQDLPRQVGRLGINTAFYATDFALQRMVLFQVLATGAIFVNSSNPSLYYVYPEALGIEYQVLTDEKDDNGFPVKRRLEPAELARAIGAAANEKGLAGRISGYTVSESVMWTTIGFLYALEWLDGNVPQERGEIDINALRRIAKEYTTQLGVEAEVTLEAITHNGEFISRYIQGVIGYHVFGK
jgi:hypothetical protein